MRRGDVVNDDDDYDGMDMYGESGMVLDRGSVDASRDGSGDAYTHSRRSTGMHDLENANGAGPTTVSSQNNNINNNRWSNIAAENAGVTNDSESGHDNNNAGDGSVQPRWRRSEYLNLSYQDLGTSFQRPEVIRVLREARYSLVTLKLAANKLEKFPLVSSLYTCVRVYVCMYIRMYVRMCVYMYIVERGTRL
jgi:hypothetical protein